MQEPQSLFSGLLTALISCISSFRNRRKIAKYKAAAAKAQKCGGEELLLASPAREPLPPSDNVLQENKSSPSNGEVSDLKGGDIVVTWKDGNTSCLYPETASDENKQEEASAAVTVEATE